MENYLIAFDLDDTIVRKLVCLSDYTVEIMQRVQEMGHFIMPATARPLDLSKPKTMKSLYMLVNIGYRKYAKEFLIFGADVMSDNSDIPDIADIPLPKGEKAQ